MVSLVHLLLHAPMKCFLTYEELYDKFVKDFGIDAIYCTSVNDDYVMEAWAKSLEVTKVQMIPDGNGELAQALGMLVKKENKVLVIVRGVTHAYVDDGVVKILLEEPNKENNYELDPYEVSDAATMYKELKKLFER